MNTATRISLNDLKNTHGWTVELLRQSIEMLSKLPEPDKISGNSDLASFYWYATSKRYAGPHVNIVVEPCHDDELFEDNSDPDNGVLMVFRGHLEEREAAAYVTVLDHDYDEMNRLLAGWLDRFRSENQ